MINLVEMIADEEECAFDQECIYGHRVDGHAVYCHNENWKNAPRKCRRNWYYGKEYAKKEKLRDRDCKGFKKNPNYKDTP